MTDVALDCHKGDKTNDTGGMKEYEKFSTPAS